jgi:sulfite reductase alpha subunit-like flavoprotein
MKKKNVMDDLCRKVEKKNEIFLFFGCRQERKDFLFEHEFKQFFQIENDDYNNDSSNINNNNDDNNDNNNKKNNKHNNKNSNTLKTKI